MPLLGGALVLEQLHTCVMIILLLYWRCCISDFSGQVDITEECPLVCSKQSSLYLCGILSIAQQCTGML